MIEEKFHFKYKNYSCNSSGDIFSYCGLYKRKLKQCNLESGRKKVSLQHGKKVVQILSYRFIWECFNGQIGDGLEINHKDGNFNNNKIENLEVVNRQQNMEHYFCKNKFIGTYKMKRNLAKPWISMIRISGKRKFLGYFSSQIEASNKFKETYKLIYGKEYGHE